MTSRMNPILWALLPGTVQLARPYRSWQEAVVWLAWALLGDQDRPSSPASSYTPLSLGPCSVCDNTARSLGMGWGGEGAIKYLILPACRSAVPPCHLPRQR